MEQWFPRPTESFLGSLQMPIILPALGLVLAYAVLQLFAYWARKNPKAMAGAPAMVAAAFAPAPSAAPSASANARANSNSKYEIPATLDM